KESLQRYEFLGELALSGELRAVTGVLPAALKAARAGRSLIVPHDNGAEAALVGGSTTHSATSLLEVCAFLRGAAELPIAIAATGDGDVASSNAGSMEPDLADVR